MPVVFLTGYGRQEGHKKYNAKIYYLLRQIC